ncbi:MAG: aminodeoxychorismate/anthranilate synthase component II [Pseudomonadota bacterium]
MIVIIDNYDSFVHNLARYVREEGGAVRVLRNDVATTADALDEKTRGVILSPGPDGPAEAGVCGAILDSLSERRPDLPVFGVCLGHQCLVEADGGETVRALKPLHGEASFIWHDGEGVFTGAPSPMSAGRYHSLASRLPETGGGLVPCAWSEEGELMGVRHRLRPLHGVQFHPESLLTPHGRVIIRNFLSLC